MKASMEASIASMESSTTSTEAFIASMGVFMEAFMDASTSNFHVNFSRKLSRRRLLPRKFPSTEASTEVTATWKLPYHPWKLPRKLSRTSRKRHVVQETVHSSSFCVCVVYFCTACVLCMCCCCWQRWAPSTDYLVILYPIIFSTYLRPKKSCLHPTVKTITHYCSSSKKSGQTNAAPSRCMTAYSTCRRSYPQRSC